MSTSTAPAFKAAVYAACQSLYAAPVQVAYGHPGLTQEQDIVSVGRTTSTQDFVTFGARAREETVTVEVIFSCYRGGGPEVEQVVEERAYSLLGMLEDHLRDTDPTLGGVVRWSQLTSIDCQGATDPDVLAAGRCSEVTAVFTAHARI